MEKPKIKQQVENIEHEIGILNELNTQNKTNLVGAVNEVTSQLAESTSQISAVETDLVANYAKKADVNSLASNKAEKSEVQALQTQLQSVASGSPKGTYATLTALQTAFPTGNSNVYVVTADGKWYYWSGTAWTAGGTYQSTGISDGSVLKAMLNETVAMQQKNFIFEQCLVVEMTTEYKMLQKGITDIKIEIPHSLQFDEIYIGKLYKHTSGVRLKLYVKQGTTITGLAEIGAIVHDGDATSFKFDYTDGTNYWNIRTFIIMERDCFMKFFNAENTIDNASLNIYKIHRTNIVRRETPVNPYDKLKFAYIKDFRLVCNDTNTTRTAKYNGIDLGSGVTPSHMSCKCVFSQGSAGGTIALISNPGGLLEVGWITNKSLHVVFTDTELKFGLYENGVLNVVYSHVYATRCSLDNVTEYTFGWGIPSGQDTQIKFTCPDGVFTYNHPSSLKTYMGRYVTLEHYYDGVGVGKPQFTYFDVKVNSVLTVLDNFNRLDGAIGNAQSGHAYAQISN